MWSDNETSQDLLGFQVHADLIGSVVMDRSLLPTTIGLFGDWGSGKTSIMQMLRRDLDPADEPPEAGHEGIACLYFNSWLFEGYDDAKAAIISSVLLALGEHRRFGPKMRDKVASLLKSVNWMRLVSLGVKHVAVPAVAAYLSGGASLIPTLANTAKALLGPSQSGDRGTPADAAQEDEAATERSESEPLGIRTFREKFGTLIEESEIDTLVVLVDDLDRCSPERIIDSLEAIKLFLNVPKTAFVIGADPRIVRHAIAVRYPTAEVEEREGALAEAQTSLVNDYLEKLIQIPYRLPRLSPAEVETYMGLLFCKRHLAPEALDTCLVARNNQLAENRYAVFGYAAMEEALGKGRIQTELASSLAFCAAAAPLVTEGLKGNPRQVKRFLNAYILRRQLADVARLASFKDEVLIKLMVLEYVNEIAFRQLFGWQAQQDGHPEQLRKIEQALEKRESREAYDAVAEELPKEWMLASVRRWVAMEPKLSEVDLRDYFWISRDRLQSTLSDLSMIPPLVRTAFEGIISDNAGQQRAASSTIAGFDPEEAGLVAHLVEQHALRHPDHRRSFRALVELAESEVQSSAESLASALTNVPPRSLAPALGLRVLRLLEAKPQYRKLLEPCVRKLASSNTKIGRAISTDMDSKPKKGGT